MRQSWRDLLDSSKMVSFRRAAILAISIVLIRLAIFAAINDRETLLLVDDIIFVIGSTLAAIGLLYGAVNSDGRSRKAWMVLAIAQFTYAIGNMIWAIIESGLHQNPFPSLADLFYLAFYPLFAAGIFLMPAEPLSYRERIKLLLDGGIVAVASVFLFWIFMIGPIFGSSEAFGLSFVISVAYPIMDLVIFIALIELIFRHLGYPGSKPHFLLAFSLATVLIVDVIFSMQTQQGSYVSSNITDTLWLIGDMLLMLAGVLQANSKPFIQPTSLSATYKKSATWAQYVPYLAIGIASFLLLWGYENHLINYSILTAFIAISIGLAFIRQKMTLDESNNLLATTQLEIGERNRTEKALKESENRYRAIFENTGTAMLIVEDNTIISLANSEFGRLTGYGIEEIEGKKYWTEFVAEEDLERMIHQHKLRRIDPDSALSSYEFRFKDRDGHFKNILLNIDLIPGTNKTVASLLDITDRKKMEEDLRESKEQYKILAESSKDLIYIITRDDRIEYVNGSAARGLGRQPEEIIGNPRSVFFPHEVAERQKLRLDEVFETGLPVHSEAVMVVGGREAWQDTHLIPLKEDEEIYAVLGISRDITEHKHAEDMLKASIAEKELLLKEVHHRVKNNLQTISTLLYLQSLNFTDDNILKVFREGQDRIKSIALIHESLYKSRNFSKVDFNEYLRYLISNLSQSYGDTSENVDFKINSDNVFLNINTAIPCGMIINELISNSLKYAFLDGKRGEICIDINHEDGGFRLLVSDNGKGFMDETNNNGSETLGFQLVETLVKQIDGNMSLDRTTGTKYEIHFSDK